MKNIFFLSCHEIGLSSMLVEQAIHLENNSEVDYFFFSGEEEQEKNLKIKLKKNRINLNIINGLDEHKKIFKLFKKLSKHINNINPDFIHVQTNWQLVLVIIVKILTFKKFKILYTIHGYRNNNKVKSILALLIMQLILFIFVKRVYSASSFVTNKFSFIKKKIKTLFLGVENSFFKYEKPLNHNKIINELILFYPAAFRDGKKQIDLIKTVEKYKSTLNNNIKLYLAGEGDDFEFCKNYVINNKLEDTIYLLGQVSRKDILNYYEKSNISIIMSNTETFGHCIAEPFVLGSCVITRNVGVAKDIISSGNNGFIFEQDTELLDILKMLSRKKDMICKVSKNAFIDREKFDWQRLVIEYVNDLKSINKGI